MEINRRNFLKLIGGVTAGAGLSNWILNTLQSSPNYSEQEIIFGPGIESWVNSLCDLCECGCGISVRLIDGVPVKISGNKLHPLNRGGVCMRGQAGLEILYNPDRIQNPMRRVGERGSRQWENITWEEAITEVVSNLVQLRTSHQQDGLVFLVNNISEPKNRLFKRFAAAFGTPYYFKCGLSYPNQAHYRLMHGSDQDYCYDLEQTNYILSFGSHFLESEPAHGWYTRMYGYMRRERKGTRVKIVQVDPQLSITGMKADEWVPIKPGTYGALALGIAHIILQEDQYDKEFIDKNTFGFNDWRDASGKNHNGFKTMILRDYTPEYVAKITGVDTETIIRLAGEFVYYKPSLALVGNRCSWNTRGVHSALAVHALNALIGNIGKPGGVIPRNNVPFTSLPPIKPDHTAAQKNSTGENLFKFIGENNGNWISSDLLIELLNKNSIQGLFLHQSNPMYYTTNPAGLQQALMNVSFIFSFSSFMDETSQLADLILPDHTFLEKWQAATSPTDVAGVHLGVSEPVLKPLYNTRDFADVLLNLSHQLGGDTAESLPWESYEAYLTAIIKGVFDSGRGTVFSESYDKSWIRILEERGWRYPGYLSFQEFWDDLKQKGGWWEPRFHAKSLIYNTFSRKFEFYLQALKDEMSYYKTHFPMVNVRKAGFYELGDEWFLPHYYESAVSEDSFGFEFYLNPYVLTALGSGEGARLPMMLEILGIHIKQKWNSWLEINPHDAKEIGLKDKDWVWMVTPRGKVKVQVKLFPAAVPGVVSIPVGLGHNKFSSFADTKGSNPLSILLPNTDPLTGQNAWSETKVKLVKI